MRNHLVDVFWSPELFNFSRAFDRNFEERSFTPAVDVEENDSHYFLALDLPGVKKEEIKIEYANDQLVVSGERKFEKVDEKRSRHVVERGTGKFRRAVALPLPVDAEKIEAVHADGVLRVAIPKAEAVKPRQIEIKSIGSVN